MGRQLFNIATALSLVLSVTAAMHKGKARHICEWQYSGTGYRLKLEWGEFYLQHNYPAPYDNRLYSPGKPVLSLGALFLTFLILPNVWLIAFVMRSPKDSSGLCAVCSYDLRATPAQCPECGTVPAKK